VIEVAARLRTVLHLVGSPVDAFHAELSRLYAAAALNALTDPTRYDMRIAYVAPGGDWQFPNDLSDEALAVAPRQSGEHGIARLGDLDVDVAVPQLFCLPGMTTYRTILDVLDIPYLGNPGSVMAVAADKARTRELVAAGGVAVPAAQLVHDDTPIDVELPVVVKPVGADNSAGVTLVRAQSDYGAAVRAALGHGGAALVEHYVEAGREARCGIVVREGKMVCLPLEEYAIDAVTKPIRGADDKLARTTDGELFLVAKDDSRAWIVADDDPITERVWAAARRCHLALDCRHYSLFDFRIDTDGQPWFLEAGLYCSFAPTSVIAVMAAAAGTPVDRLFADVLAELDRERSQV
jgi:D-alanine-D-alanine ligase